jgi:hypothetical protein
MHHARYEPAASGDHLVQVRVFASIGVMLGVGHTISLVVVGALLLATGTALSDRVAAGLELAVAGMLVVLDPDPPRVPSRVIAEMRLAPI